MLVSLTLLSFTCHSFTMTFLPKTHLNLMTPRVVVVANCYDYGRSIWVEGPYELKSKGGYLRGDLFQEWHFFIFFTVCYISFFCWFARSMNENKNSTIGIQKWILGTIFLGGLELFFKSCDYYAWNKSGLRTNGIMFICKCNKEKHCTGTLSQFWCRNLTILYL